VNDTAQTHRFRGLKYANVAHILADREWQIDDINAFERGLDAAEPILRRRAQPEPAGHCVDDELAAGGNRMP
jgi:hypothetical protein